MGDSRETAPSHTATWPAGRAPEHRAGFRQEAAAAFPVGSSPVQASCVGLTAGLLRNKGKDVPFPRHQGLSPPDAETGARPAGPLLPPSSFCEEREPALKAHPSSGPHHSSSVWMAIVPFSGSVTKSHL